MRLFRGAIGRVSTLLTVTALQASPVAAQHGHHSLPDSIALPSGWQPEGITTTASSCTRAHLPTAPSSAPTSAPGSARSSRPVPPAGWPPGWTSTSAATCCGSVGGPTGEIRAQDAGLGKVVATYEFPSATGTVPQRRGRDPRRRVRHRLLQPGVSRSIPLKHIEGHGKSQGDGHGNGLPPASAATTLPLTGDVVFSGRLQPQRHRRVTAHADLRAVQHRVALPDQRAHRRHPDHRPARSLGRQRGRPRVRRTPALRRTQLRRDRGQRRGRCLQAGPRADRGAI